LVSVKIIKECFFNYSIPSYELSIKFNDSKHVAQSSLLNISYEIRLHDTCGNRFNKIMKLNEIFRKTGIPSGDYFLEIIPKVETIFCKDQCPVFVNKNGLFENEVQCEDCRKMIKFIQIKNNKDNFEEYIDKTFAIQTHDNVLFIETSALNQTILLNHNATIIFPSGLNPKICNKTLVFVCPKQANLLLFTIIFISIIIILPMAILIAVVYYVISAYSEIVF